MSHHDLDSPQVLIVGAGPSGLVLALSLLKNGIPVRIIEKELEHATRIFKGSGISPRTQEVEHFLGVLSDVKKLSSGPLLHIYAPNDPRHPAKVLDFVNDYKPSPSFPITQVQILGQSRHQDVLRKHVEALGGHVELGTEFSALQQDESGVTVSLTKTIGDTKIEETAKVEYVIGTDGGRSAVRKSLGIEFLGETMDLTMLLADVQLEGFDGKGMHKWGEAGKNVVQLNSHGEPNMYQLLCGGPWFDREAVLADGSIERLQQEFNKCINRPDIKIIKIYSKGEWRPNIRMATHFRSGRVFLAGDAAHTHPPAGGQGLNTSVMDSFNLAWKLALVLKGFSSPSFLDSYESERLPIVAEMLKISTSLMQVVFKRNKDTEEAVKKAQEDGILAKDIPGEDAAWKRGWKLTQLDLNYRHSPVVLDERFKVERGATTNAYGTEGHSLRAGDRAPEATDLRVCAANGSHTQTTKFFDIFSPAAHSVLIFPTANEDDTQLSVDSVLEILQELPSGLVRSVLILPKSYPDTYDPTPGIDFVVSDDKDHAYTNYGLNTDVLSVVIVRPDAYIGGIVNGADGIRKYFSMVFNKSA